MGTRPETVLPSRHHQNPYEAGFMDREPRVIDCSQAFMPDLLKIARDRPFFTNPQADATHYARPRFEGADIDMRLAGSDLLPFALSPDAALAITHSPLDPLAASAPLRARVAGGMRMSLRPTQAHADASRAAAAYAEGHAPGSSPDVPLTAVGATTPLFEGEALATPSRVVGGACQHADLTCRRAC